MSGYRAGQPEPGLYSRSRFARQGGTLLAPCCPQRGAVIPGTTLAQIGTLLAGIVVIPGTTLAQIGTLLAGIVVIPGTTLAQIGTLLAGIVVILGTTLADSTNLIQLSCN